MLDGIYQTGPEHWSIWTKINACLSKEEIF